MPLPAQLDTNGEWEAVVERLYDCFCSIFFADPRLLVEGRLLTIDGRLIEDNKEEGFWHVVTRGPEEKRKPDFDRARRMPWIPTMLDGTAEGLTRWKFQEGNGRTRLYYWLENENYALILEENRRVVALVTAFFVDRSRTFDELTEKRGKGDQF